VTHAKPHRSPRTAAGRSPGVIAPDAQKAAWNTFLAWFRAVLDDIDRKYPRPADPDRPAAPPRPTDPIGKIAPARPQRGHDPDRKKTQGRARAELQDRPARR